MSMSWGVGDTDVDVDLPGNEAIVDRLRTADVVTSSSYTPTEFSPTVGVPARLQESSLNKEDVADTNTATTLSCLDSPQVCVPIMPGNME